MKNFQTFFCALFVMALTPSFVMAGGLDDATNTIKEIQVWAYGFLGVSVLLYMIYQIILAMLEKITWMDVITSVAKVAAAGGSVALATWAWGIWGS